MQVDVPTFLRLTEQAHTLLFWDVESQGLAMDYGGVLCVSVKPYGQPPITYYVPAVNQSDKFVVKDAAEHLAQADAWVTYYGKGFDVKVLNARLLRWGLPPLAPKPHLDLFFHVKGKFQFSRKSQAHVLEFLETEQQKMTVSPNVWADMRLDWRKHMRVMIARCESDVAGLEKLYDQAKRFVRDITR